MRHGRGGALLLFLGDLLNEPRRQRGRDDAEKSDAVDHQGNGNEPAGQCHGVQIAVANRRHADDGPPQGVPEIRDEGFWVVPLGIEHGEGGDVDEQK